LQIRLETHTHKERSASYCRSSTYYYDTCMGVVVVLCAHCMCNTTVLYVSSTVRYVTLRCVVLDTVRYDTNTIRQYDGTHY